MPRKPFDSRILNLATVASVKLSAAPSLDPIPVDLVTAGGMHADQPNYPWPWADVTFMASYGGVSATYTDTGITCADETAYRRSKEYTQALQRVLAQLLGKLDTAAEALANLGT